MSRKTQYNLITSPELLAQVNPKNTQLKNDYLDYLRSIQRSEATVNAYSSDIDIAWVWCLQHNDNKFFPEWTKRNIVALQGWLTNEHGNSPARVRRVKSVLSSLSNYIESVLDDEFPNFRNIVTKVENPVNTPTREKTVLTDEMVNELYDKLLESGQIEKACALALADFSGRRKSELFRFRVCDFNEENLVCDGALFRTSEKIRTKGRGAGKFIYCYTLANGFRPYFQKWMEYRAEHGIESEWLFPSPYDPAKPRDTGILDSWAASFSRMIDEDFYWHAMRHRMVTNLIRAGLPDSVVKEIIGWEDVSMVSVYTDMNAEERIGMFFKNGEIDTSSTKGLGDL